MNSADFFFISIMDFGVWLEICLAMGQNRPKKCLIMLNFLPKSEPVLLLTCKNRPNDAVPYKRVSIMGMGGLVNV